MRSDFKNMYGRKKFHWKNSTDEELTRYYFTGTGVSDKTRNKLKDAPVCKYHFSTSFYDENELELFYFLHNTKVARTGFVQTMKELFSSPTVRNKTVFFRHEVV